MQYQIHQSFLAVQDSTGIFFLLLAQTPMCPYHYQFGGHMLASLKSTKHEKTTINLFYTDTVQCQNDTI